MADGNGKKGNGDGGNGDYPGAHQPGGYFQGRPGPGRPKGAIGGRMQALQVLDTVLAKAENKKLLAEELEKLFRLNPPMFLVRFVYPILPKQTMLSVKEEARAQGRAVHAAIVQAVQEGVLDVEPEQPTDMDT